MMKKAKQKMLENKRWKVGTAEEFLGLSPVESRYIELKLARNPDLRERFNKVNVFAPEGKDPGGSLNGL